MTAPLLYGKYQLIELIARGGMAEVYKAKSHGVEGFEKLVVIKRILPEFSQDSAFVEMFINEAKISVTLSHANIIQVFDLGRSDDSYFIAMEYVYGLDLAEIVARVRAQRLEIPIEISVFIASEVAKGLDYAHRRKDQNMNPLGIVHRDISPQNILVSYEGEVKITDFGIAWALGNASASETLVKGKARYMAPEQARGQAVDKRTDLFSLAVVLYEVLAGVNPLRRVSESETLELLQQGGYRPLSDVSPTIPRELCSIVDKAMAIEPSDRHSDAGRLYEELMSYLYTTTRRVGVHDLAVFLKEFRDVESPPKEAVTDHTLRVAFGDESGATPSRLHHSADTPVERPKVTTVKRVAEEGGAAKAIRPELWDVSALAWESLGRDSDIDVATLLGELIEREGGYVVESHEDFAKALFGLEDRDGRDTEAATHCAIKALRLITKIQSRVTTELAVGFGVHTNKVVVVPPGPLPQEDHRYFALLDRARALASRESGAIVLSEDARCVVRDLYNFRDRGGNEWCVEGARPLGEVYGRFVGRREELRSMGEQLAFSNRGSGSVLFIVGEHGTGKTRLLHETRKRLTAGGHDFSWYQARCLPHFREIPYSSLTMMLQALLGVDETDDVDKVSEQVDRLRELGLNAEEIRAVSQLFGVPDDLRDSRSSQLDREARVALLHIATSLAQDRLTILAWDSAELMDRQTIDSLAALSHGSHWSRVLVLLACRPPIGDCWNIVANSRFLELTPLEREDIFRLAAARLGVENLPSSLIDELTEKSMGNPLYIEEYIKALIASEAVSIKDDQVQYRPEVAEIEVPKSLRGLLVDRIKRLDRSLHSFLQRAAVMTPRFTTELLAAVAVTTVDEAQEAVDRLLCLEIIEKTGREEYSFQNDMLREVVYDGMTFADRKEIHRTVATELERLYSERLEEVYERLAEHFRESGHKDKAVDYLSYAGEKLTSENAYKAAFWHFYRAIELFQTLPDPDHSRMLVLHRQMGECAVESDITEVAIEKLRLGVELAETAGVQEATVELLTLIGRLYEKANRFSEAHRYFNQALNLSEQVGDDKIRCSVFGSIGEALARNGEYRQATEYLEAALDLARSAGDRRREATLLRELGLCWAARGRAEQARECIEAVDIAAEALGDHLLQCETLKFRGLVSYMIRDDVDALQAFNAAVEMAKEYGFDYEIAANSHNVGDIQIRTGDYRAAFTALCFSYEVSRQHGYTKLETLNSMLLGFIDAVSYRSIDGVSRIEQALEFAQDHGYTWDAIQATYFLGKARLAVGDTRGAKEALREAIRIGRATDSRMYVEDCQRLLAGLESVEKDDETESVDSQS